MQPHTGQALWHLLHAYAHALPEGDLSPAQIEHAQAFLAAFDEAVRLASHGTCPCHQHWAALKAARPPDLTSRRAFWWWTARIHDEVNARLGKPRRFPEGGTAFPPK